VTVQHSAQPSAPSGPLVAGYNGSPEAKDALALSRDLAAVLQAPICAVAVLTAAPLEIDLRAYATELREAGELLQESAQRELEGIKAAEVVTVPAPSPARELDRIASLRDAQMVVLGSTSRGPLRRVVPGTVAGRLLAGGSCPVAIAPRGYGAAEHTIRRIGVGFDGSPESRNAVAYAAEIAGRVNGRLDLIAVANPAMPAELPAYAHGYAGLIPSPDVTREQVDYLWEAASRAVKELVPAHVTATVHVLQGVPAAELSARSPELDLLVLGSRGYGPLGRVLMGSVSAAVLRDCSCPLVVIPRPDGRRESHRLRAATSTVFA
jgi:nucleotide-binding universal stress UspA family protein